MPKKIAFIGCLVMGHVLIVDGVWQFGHQIFYKLIWCSVVGMGLVVGVVIPRNIMKKWFGN
jgi:hypothetical protein